MQTKKVQGIVVNETNYSESSKILIIYTKELGAISVISKGCRKLKSSLRSVSSKLTYGYFIIRYKENGVSTLISVDVLDTFKNIMIDIVKISYASCVLELAYQVAKQNQDDQIFDLLIVSLKKMNENFSPDIITLIVELKLLKHLGIDINVDGCANCGNDTDIVTLNVDVGGYICSECYNGEPILSSKTVKVFRMLYYVDLKKVSKLKLCDTTVKELDSFLDEYYTKYSGVYLKSKKFIELFNNKL